MNQPNLRSRAEALLQGMLGRAAQFRSGQFEAIEALVERRQRLLVVQRTGWGKSLGAAFSSVNHESLESPAARYIPNAERPAR